MKRSSSIAFGFCFAGFWLLTSYSVKAKADSSYYAQEIRYWVEDASAVHVVWGINGWKNTPEAYRRPETFVSDRLLYTPMTQVEDTFVTIIQVPEGASIEFDFWISHNARGELIDIWDTNGGGEHGYHARADKEGAILVIANPEKPEVPDHPTIVDQGWKLFLLLLVLWGLGLGMVKLFFSRTDPVSYPQRIVLTAFSLYLFHLLARLNILNLGLGKFSLSSLAYGLDDLIYVAVLTGIFLLLGGLFKSERAKKVLFGAFCGLSFLSLLLALLNIDVVAQLGRPFNYQWLYYSGFLGSDEARSALAANLSWGPSFNLLALCLAMLLLGSLMVIVMRMARKVKYLPQAALALVFLFAITTIGLTKTAKTWYIEQGKLENPVCSFIRSIWEAQSQPALFQIEVPANFQRPVLSDPGANLVPGKVKNVLLIVLESAGAKYFDLYGARHEVTPNLNRYFEHSLLFENIYAHAPATNKSMVSMLCSVFPWISHQTLTQEKPDFVQPSLSGELKKAGFRTSFLSSTNLDFQRAEDFLAARSFDEVVSFESIPCEQRFKMAGNGDGFGTGIDDACLVPYLSQWLDQQPNQAFFSMLWTHQAHYPYFLSGEERDFGVANINYNKYLNAVAHDDAMIGQVIDSLKARGLFDSTLVVIAGDHGEAFGQHRQYGHGSHLYEENLRVPLILINPNLFQGERVSHLGGLVDLAPTILALTDQALPEGWQGTSLLQTQREDKAFFFAPWSNYLFGCRIGDTKVILDETNQLVEIYDLGQDPDEQNNLIEQYTPEQLDTFRLHIAAWIQQQQAWIEQQELIQ
jgi:lipoteichoic acid synthase